MTPETPEPDGEATSPTLIERALEREWRAKYKKADRDEAVKKGEAMPDGSYIVKDADDLKKAIRAVGRGNADHDAIRKFIIKRAAALKMSSSIPENWEADGSLKEEKSVWSTLEERETYNDRRQLVESAISDSLPKPKKGEINYYSYVMDMDDGMAVYEYQGDYFQVDYTIDADDGVTLEKPVKVHRVTTYEVDVEAKSGEGESEKRVVENDDDEDMETCPTCGGDGKVKGNSTECPDCEGSGEVEKNSRDGSRALERRRLRVESERASKSFEHRDFSLANCEFRATDDDDGLMRFSGYASLTEVPYSVGGFTETIKRGAFKRTLSESPDVVFRIEHQDLPLARTERPGSISPGSLRLEETDRGLKVDAIFDGEDPDAQKLKLKMERGLVDQMSFAFRTTDDEWNEAWDERTIKSLSLHGGDVSVVTFGASPTTGSTTSIRSANGECEFRAGKALSKSTEAQIQTLVDTLAGAGEELQGLLPSKDEPAAVTPFEGFSTNGRSMMPEIHIHLNGEEIAESVRAALPKPEVPVVEPEVETLSMPEVLEGEWREKYPEENRGEIEAISEGYFGVDEEDLVKAIQNVSRGDEKYDTVRAEAVKWAETLHLSDLIPDNWVPESGVLKETNGAWGDTEARESYNDQRALVEKAVKDMLQDEKSGEGECYVYCYVLDMSSDWAVYRYEGDLYQVNFTQEGDVVSLDEPVKVRAISGFEEVTEPPPARSARAADWAAQEQEIELLKRRAA